MALKVRKGGAWERISSKANGLVMATASGALSAGDPVVINTDGTVSKVADNGSGTNLTVTNFLGFSESAYSNNDTATINIVGSVNTNQSGLLTGKKYYVQVDGTLSTTAGDPRVEAGIALSSTTLLINAGGVLGNEGYPSFTTDGWRIPF